MPGLLKPKIKQTIVLNMDIDTALASLQNQFGTSWQIETQHTNSDTIDFRAVREGIEILGHLERWQGTDSRLHLDGEVLSKVPYENWREWTGVGTFIALIAIWVLVTRLPLTEVAFRNLFYLIGIGGALGMFVMALIVAIFLGVPFLVQRYFTHLSPDIRKYNENLNHLANFVSSVKALQNTQQLDTSRLEEQEALPLAENLHESSKTQSSEKR